MCFSMFVTMFWLDYRVHKDCSFVYSNTLFAKTASKHVDMTHNLSNQQSICRQNIEEAPFQPKFEIEICVLISTWMPEDYKLMHFDYVFCQHPRCITLLPPCKSRLSPQQLYFQIFFIF